MWEYKDTKQISSGMDILKEGIQVWIANIAAWGNEAEVVSINSHIHLLFNAFIKWLISP